jgi:hypothetical protein
MVVKDISAELKNSIQGRLANFIGMISDSYSINGLNTDAHFYSSVFAALAGIKNSAAQ